MSDDRTRNDEDADRRPRDGWDGDDDEPEDADD
jgi:hypothetical protein